MSMCVLCGVHLQQSSNHVITSFVFLSVRLISRFPSLPVNSSGQLKMRRQSSELFLDGVLSPPCQRMGAMVAFQCFDDFKRSVSSWCDFFLLFQPLWLAHLSPGNVLFIFFCRNFDEVLSSFVEPLLEGSSMGESCSGFYEEECVKVSVAGI